MTTRPAFADKPADNTRKAQLAYAYLLGFRRVWATDLTAGNGAYVLQIAEDGSFVELAHHSKVSRLWHPRVAAAFRRAAGDMIFAADTAAIGGRVLVAPSTLPVSPDRGFSEVSSTVAVMVEN